jgi:3-hydroxyisobutyrate dehydrogenase-like beta-hydroxyacid dehydrogenase
MVATSEALVLGTKLGLKPQTMLEVISQSSGHSYALSAKAENFIFKGDFQKGFAIDLQYKDLEMATSAAKKKVVPLFLGNLSQQLFEMARAKGLGREDISSVIKIFEELSQTEVRTKS